MTVSVRINLLYIIPNIVLLPGEIWLIYTILAVSYILFFLCIFVSPGYVTPENEKRYLRRFPANRIIFFDGSRCTTCKTLKVPRSRHCSICDRCVLVNDHHCIWLNTCVGLHNFKYFLVFLVSIIVIFVYGFVLNLRFLLQNGASLLGTLTLSNLSVLKSLDPKLIITTYFRVYLNFYSIILKSVSFEDSSNLKEKFSIIFLIICCIFGVVIPVFLAGILENEGTMGMTEYERQKWEDVHDKVSYHQLFKYYLNQDEKDDFACEILSDQRGDFVYIKKTYEEKGQNNSPQRVKKSCLSLIVLRKKQRYEKTHELGVVWVKYVTLNNNDPKEVVISEDNRNQVALVRDIDELENIYDTESFARNMLVFF